MAEALIKGVLEAKLYSPSQLFLMEPDKGRCQYMHAQYNLTVSSSPDEIWSHCDAVILAVKPQVMEKVLNQGKKHVRDNHLVISIAAGLPISFYISFLGDTAKLIRVMPNTPCLVQEGASALCYNKNVDESEIETTLNIFNAVGKAIVMDESHLDSVTGLSGSGPAYVFTFLEALIDAGVKTGLTREASEMLSVQTILGSIKLFQESEAHPAQLRAQVTSPGGTTIAGLHVMERKGFRGIIMDAIEAATTRSMELGKGKK